MLWHRSQRGKSLVKAIIAVAFALGTSLGTYAKADIAQGLQAYWPLDEGIGSAAADISGNGHDGTLTATGIDWVAGKVGGAVDCHGTDGVDGYIDIAEHADFRPDYVSVQAWVNIDSFGTWEGIIGNMQWNGSDQSGWCLFVHGSNTIIFYVSVGGSVKGASVTVSTGQWTHIVGVYDGSAVKIYKDGEPSATTDGEGVIDYTFMPLTVRIGQYYDDNEQFALDGRVDEVAVWDRVLSSDEIAYLWNDGDGRSIEVHDHYVGFAEATSRGPEDGDPVNVEVILSSPVSDANVSVNYTVIDITTDANDYAPYPAVGTLIFEPDVTTQLIDITALDDTEQENDEQFIIVLSDPNGPDVGLDIFAEHVYTILSSDNPAKDPNIIIPLPQVIERLSSAPVQVSSDWQIVIDIAVEDDVFAAEYLQDAILNKNPKVEPNIVDISAMAADKRIVIGDPNQNAIVAQLALSYGIDINAALANDFDQGYVLLINPDEILILAKSTAGTFYGMISLTWLLEVDGKAVLFPHTKITDWPDFHLRGFYGRGRYLWEGEVIDTRYDAERERWIEELAKYKYNMWSHSLYGILDLGQQAEQEARKEFLLQRHFYPSTSFSPEELRGRNENMYEGVFAQNISLQFEPNDYAASREETVFYNYDFEGGLPAGWYYSGNNEPNDYWSVASDDQHGGQNSAKLVLTKDNTDVTGSSSSAFLVSPSYDVEPNRIYFITFWGKVDNVDANDRNPQFTLVPLDQAGQANYTNSRLIEHSEWTQYYMPLSTYNGEKRFYLYSRASGTKPLNLWIDDIRITELNDKLANIIKTRDNWVEVWNQDRTTKYVEGVDYFRENEGDYNYKNPPAGKKTRIKRIPQGNIPELADIVVDYDYLLNFQQWRDEGITLSDPNVLHEYDKYIRDTMTILQPEYVFIAMDEIRGFNRDSRAKFNGKSNSQVLGEFLNEIVSIIHGYNANTKVLIWDDMINPYHNGGNEYYQARRGGLLGKSWYALYLMERENVVLISWWYGAGYHHQMKLSPQLYNGLGFDFVGGPWDTPENIKWWSYLCYTNNARGIIGHEFYERIGGVKDVANYAWNAVKDYDEPNNPSGPNDPRQIDTDGDGLSDYDEITIYHTDLSEVDTDRDGINDDMDQCPNFHYTLADFNEDCAINLLDFAILAHDWLKCTNPADAGCENILE